MNNENKHCVYYIPHCKICNQPKTSEQVCEHGDKSEQMSKHAGAHCLCPVRKIEPLPEPYSDDHFRKAVVNKINELIKIINKN